LVYEVGRLDAPGRPALFATTEEFLRRFGIGSTQNLPVADPVVAAEIRLQVEEELSDSGDLISEEDKNKVDFQEEIK
jgi:segregation and condensation protein B